MYQRASTITCAPSPTSRSSNLIHPPHSLQPTLRFRADSPKLNCFLYLWCFHQEAPITAKVTPQITVESETRSQNIGTGYPQNLPNNSSVNNFFIAFTTFSNPASPCTKQRPAQQPSHNTVSFLLGSWRYIIFTHKKITGARYLHLQSFWQRGNTLFCIDGQWSLMRLIC